MPKKKEEKSNKNNQKKKSSQIQQKCNQAKLNNKTEKKSFIQTFLKNKKNIFNIILLIIDIFIIIYFARHNFAHYVSLEGAKAVFIGDTKDLLFGKNYISLIVTLFFYIYILLSNKILFHQKNSKKNIINLLIFLILLNTILFIIFTKRIY